MASRNLHSSGTVPARFPSPPPSHKRVQSTTDSAPSKHSKGPAQSVSKDKKEEAKEEKALPAKRFFIFHLFWCSLIYFCLRCVNNSMHGLLDISQFSSA